MLTQESVVIKSEKWDTYFEVNMMYYDKKYAKKQRVLNGIPGYYAKLVPVELSEAGKKIKRYPELSKIKLLLESDRETKSKLITARYERDDIIRKIDEGIEDEKEYMDKVVDYIKLKKQLGDSVLEEIYENMNNEGRRRFGMGKSSSKFTPEKDVKTTFKDVAGLKEVKEELYEITDYIKDKDKYIEMGAKIPKGFLFYGPPGTGKTLICRAIAGETNSSFYYVSGAEFTEKYVGVGAQRVRDLFNEARKNSPSIIFIDEIDSLVSKRSQDTNAEKDQTLNQLLTEMDGFKQTEDIIVIGATNRKDLLDDAVLRPGRLGKHVYIGNPDLETRKELFEIHTSGKKLSEDVDLESLAKKTHGFSGADIENIANESALIAVREGRSTISQKNLEVALEKVVCGLSSKTKKVRDKEKQIVSYHESGHALARIMLGISKIQKISIIPHGEALGFVMNTPDEDRYLYTKEEMMSEIKVLLAGRVAEEIKFKSYTTGASNDLERASIKAMSMVCRYGMCEEIGLISRPVSSISELKDDEKKYVNGILQNAYSETKQLLEDNFDMLEKLAQYLYENEEMSLEDVDKLLKDDLKVASSV